MKNEISGSGPKGRKNIRNLTSADIKKIFAIEGVAGNNMSDKKWMSHIQDTINTIKCGEIISLTALISYVSSKTGKSDFRVERELADYFNIPNIKCLSADKYDDAVTFLVTQVPQI